MESFITPLQISFFFFFKDEEGPALEKISRNQSLLSSLHASPMVFCLTAIRSTAIT